MEGYVGGEEEKQGEGKESVFRRLKGYSTEWSMGLQKLFRKQVPVTV
jgi:hypothetical protein